MRIRPVVLVVAVLAVAGCGGPGNETAPNVPPLVSVSTTPTETPSETPSPSTPPTAKVAETLCVRMDQPLVQSTLGVPVVTLQTKAAPADFGLPTYDVCQFGLSTSPNGPVLRVGISVLPATKATLAGAQKAYAATKGEPAKPAVVGEGGFGTSTFVVFLLDGRLYKVSGPPATLAKYVVLGQEVVRQAPGLPEAQPLIARPDCERGSSAAEKVMGAPAMVRRDGQTALGDLVCGWVNPNQRALDVGTAYAERGGVDGSRSARPRRHSRSRSATRRTSTPPPAAPRSGSAPTNWSTWSHSRPARSTRTR